MNRHTIVITVVLAALSVYLLITLGTLAAFAPLACVGLVGLMHEIGFVDAISNQKDTNRIEEQPER